ncbi:MAG: ABC transporter permease [Solirubrobacteraceae bacterium]
MARREIDERARAKSFWITSAIMVLAVAAAVVVPSLIGKHHTVEKVGLLGAAAAAVTQAAKAAGRVTGDGVTIVPVASLGDARAKLRAGTVVAVVVDGRSLLLKQRPGAGTTASTSSFTDALAQLVGLVRTLPPTAAAAALATGVAVPVSGVEPPPRSLAARLTGLGADLVIYIAIFFYGMRIAQAVGEEKTSRVVEEKTSRVVEVMLATIRPAQLLTGKVIGFAALALTQMLALGVAFAVSGLAVGSDSVHGAAAGVAVMGALWLILGYALYCSAFAAAGAMVTRQSDAANASFPLLIPLIVAYSLSNGVLFNGSNGFYDVLAYIPWTAPVAMPTLFAIGAASAWEVALSALITVAATILTARVAGVVYQRSVMRTGARVKLRQVLRSDAA